MSEYQEQCALMDWSALVQYRGRMLREWLFAIPNGGDRNPIIAAKMQAEGVTPGVPDLCLPIPLGCYHGLWIEMKARDGRPTPEQRVRIAQLNDDGYRAVFCYGADEAMAEIRRYLSLGPWVSVERGAR